VSGKKVALVLGATVLLVVVVSQLWFVRASLDLTARAEGRVIDGRVTTDLPDGARLYYEVYPLLDDLEFADVTSGELTVVGGATEFAADLSGTSWSTNEVEVVVSFHMIETEQPAHLVEMFGRNGERLSGAGIYRSDDGYKVMAVSTIVVLEAAP
jgi:hypothetical protein